jgi:hypothetical protein
MVKLWSFIHLTFDQNMMGNKKIFNTSKLKLTINYSSLYMRTRKKIDKIV